MLSEELGLQKLLEGREGRPCSGSTRQFVPPTWNYYFHDVSVTVCAARASLTLMSLSFEYVPWLVL